MALGPHDLRLEPFANLWISGSTGTGKTFLCCQLVLQRNRIFKQPTDGCVYFYQHWQPCFDQIKEQDPEVEFVSTVAELEESIKRPHLHYLLVVDDFLSKSLYEEKRYITEFFLNKTHHYACSTLFQSQLLFPRNLKSLTLNSAHIVLLKSSNHSQIHHFLRQISPTKWKALFAAYSDCCENTDYGIFVCILHARTPSEIKYRDFILARPGGRIFIPK